MTTAVKALPAGKSRFRRNLRRDLDTLGAAEKKLVLEVWNNRGDFVRWAKRSRLLLKGRMNEHRGKKYHSYPRSIVSEAKKAGIRVDRRSNGPAVMVYRLAGGERPMRRDGKQGWNIHHLYDGRFPANGSGKTLRAVKDGKHFTQAAGLVAIHPMAHACAHEYFWFAWKLRREAFRRFGYDPDGVFSARTGRMGFKTK
jgi:hypothetical protein